MKRQILLVFVIVSSLFLGCEKAIDDPQANPFVTNPVDTSTNVNLDPYSIEGLHKNIFSLKCANPTCHDGTFEPDFRTVQSTYNTLVYQPVIKNNAQNSFVYRVVPGNLQASWLVERLTTNDPNLGRMPLYAPSLSYDELLWVYGWITDGAKDLNGNAATFPNTPPKVNYFVAYDAGNIRIDTNRQAGWSSPFIVNQGSTFSMLISVEDDSTSTPNLLLNQLKVSPLRDDFTNAQTLNAVFYSGKLWSVSINTTNFSANTQYYFRYYVKDDDNPVVAEFPRDDIGYWYKENASFIIQ